MNDSSIYKLEGTQEEILAQLRGTFGDSLSEKELRILFKLEIDSIQKEKSSKEELDRFWLYDDTTQATWLAGDTKYSIPISETSCQIIQKVISYAAIHVTIEETGPTLTPEQSAIKKVLFIYDILSTIYKHLYKLEDYEWCFCFSAASYLKQNSAKYFSAADVLKTLHLDSENICKHIGDTNVCTFHNAEDCCRLNNDTVKDVIKHLSDNNVIQPAFHGSDLYYSFVF